MNIPIQKKPIREALRLGPDEIRAVVNLMRADGVEIPLSLSQKQEEYFALKQFKFFICNYGEAWEDKFKDWMQAVVDRAKAHEGKTE